DGSALPWDPRGLHSARVRPTWTLDLETGEQGTPGADLHWGMKSRDDPYLATQNGAGIARANVGWDALDVRALDSLAYQPDAFPARGPDAPVKKGAVFAVRTRGGNLAKLRVKDIRGDYSLVVEWRVFPAAAVAQAQPRMEKAPAETAKAAPRAS